ncbi:hypothetical protein E4U46_005959 [Claviceps purpurea]|nr:hypothetical protein E4U27_005183 [Claviceps purpurea]KAG6285334.1 hypothetical protein E4U46_005959 [Claviceps purpurea]
MQVFNIIAIFFAAVASASPVNSDAITVEAGVASIHLPPGCKKHELALCALRLIGTTASCGPALLEGGANPIADLACIASAAKTAVKLEKCKNCIPKIIKAVEI